MWKMKKAKDKKISWTESIIKDYFGDGDIVQRVLEAFAEEGISSNINENADEFLEILKWINKVKGADKHCEYRLLAMDEDKIDCAIISARACIYRSSRTCPIYKNKGERFLFSLTRIGEIFNAEGLNPKDVPLVKSIIQALDKTLSDGFCPREIALALFALYDFLVDFVVDRTVEIIQKNEAREMIVEGKIKLAHSLRKKGKIREELQILKKIEKTDKKYCKGYDAVEGRIVELEIKLGKRPSFKSLKRTIKHNGGKIILKYAKEQGISLMQKNDYAGAIEYFEIIPKKYLDSESFKIYAACCEETGDIKSAYKLYKRVSAPESHLNLAACNFKLQKYEECWKEVTLLFSFENISVKTLEAALKMVKDLDNVMQFSHGDKDDILNLCNVVLSKKPESKVARGIFEKIKREKKERINSRKKTAGGFIKQRKFRLACNALLKIPKDEQDGWIIKKVAFCYKKEGDYKNSLIWYKKLLKPKSKDILWDMILFALKERDFNFASELCQELKGMNIDMNGIPHPDVKAFILEGEGNYEDAIDCYVNKDLILQLADKLEKDKKFLLCAKCFLNAHKKLAPKGYKKKAEDILEKYEDSLPIREKVEVRRSLEKKYQVSLSRKELVICDTNIFVHKGFYGTCGYERLDKNMKRRVELIVSKFNFLSNTQKIGATDTSREQLRPVCERLFVILNVEDEKEQKIVMERAKKYIKKYKQDVVIDEGALDKVRKFYLPFVFHTKKITEWKIKNKSENETTKIIGRRDGGLMPEESDMKLLAECISLYNSRVKGVNQISLLSDDTDFKEFRDEIKSMFDIKVY